MSGKSKGSKIANSVACRQKAKAGGIQIFRPVLGEAGSYEVKAFAEPPWEDSDWVYLDVWTASMVYMVYDVPTGEKREHFFRPPPLKAIRVSWEISNAIEGES